MKEIDFEELDRAVNTVLGSKPADDKTSSPSIGATASITPDESTVVSPTATTQSHDDTVTTNTDDTISPQATTVPDKETTDPEEDLAPVASPQAATAITPRRGGRFMDLVHPSADMKIGPATSERSTLPPSRSVRLKPLTKTTDIARTTTDTVEPANDKQFIDDRPSVDLLTEETHDDAPQNAISAHTTDDTSSSLTDNTDNETLTNQTSLTAGAVHHGLASSVPDVEDSPFLSDAEVEKRPLGSFGTQSGHDHPKNTDDHETLSATHDMPLLDAGAEEKALPAGDVTEATAALPDNQDRPVGTPREFDKDVIAVDEVDHMAGQTAGEDKIQTNTDDTPKEQPANAKPVSDPTLQTASRRDESVDHSKHPIFDTGEYHTAIVTSHGNKGRSSTSWAAIIVLLFLAVAVGAYYWFFMR